MQQFKKQKRIQKNKTKQHLRKHNRLKHFFAFLFYIIVKLDVEYLILDCRSHETKYLNKNKMQNSKSIN